MAIFPVRRLISLWILLALAAGCAAPRRAAKTPDPVATAVAATLTAATAKTSASQPAATLAPQPAAGEGTPSAAARPTQSLAASAAAPAVTAAPTATSPAAAPSAKPTKKPGQGGAGKPTRTAPAATPAPGGYSDPAAFPTSAYVPADAQFNVILGRPTDTSVAVSLYARADVAVRLSYGAAPGNYTAQTEALQLQAGVPQTLELSGLQPDTTYYYQISAAGAPAAEHSFHTQRPAGASFVFTLDADPHNRDPRFNGELYATTLTNALADHPDFHVNLGDTFMTEKVQARTPAEIVSTFADMRPYFGLLTAGAPLFLVNGNHEGELGWLLKTGDQQLPLGSVQARQQFYPNPTPNTFYAGAAGVDAALGAPRDGYYAWTWGDALFIVLDPYWYTTNRANPSDLNTNWGWTLGREQYDWLKATLAGSSAKFKFIFVHNLVGGKDKDARGGVEAAPYFEWGGQNADGSYGFDAQRPGWGQPIHQLLVANHVSAVFHGHDHVFVKQDLDGIVYQELPQPSNAESRDARLAADYGYTHGDALGGSGHLRVTVTPTEAVVEYVRAVLPGAETGNLRNGQVDYRYTLPAP